jgi:hypothetical protein
LVLGNLSEIKAGLALFLGRVAPFDLSVLLKFSARNLPNQQGLAKATNAKSLMAIQWTALRPRIPYPCEQIATTITAWRNFNSVAVPKKILSSKRVLN